MVRSRTLSVLAIGIVLVLAAVVEAADFCVSINSGASGAHILVGKAFRVPSKGSCRTFNGIIQNAFGGLFSGNACTASNGGYVEFNLMGSAGGIQALNFYLPLPSLTGGTGLGIYAVGGIGTTDDPFTADKVACSPPVVPVL